MSQSLATIFIMATFVGMWSAVIAGDERPPKFKITSKRDNDKVEVKVEKDKTVVSVHSPFGISQASIERTDEKWPENVVVRLQLKGLENFRAMNGKVTINAAVSFQDGKDDIRLWKDADEDTPLDAKSPYWTKVRIVDGDDKAARDIPLKEGYFELQLPKAFFEDNPKSITLNWIDFYRT